MKIFAERLKELRTEKELSQVNLAKAVNLSKTAIAQWELEKRTPNAEAVVELAKFFGVSADYLLGITDDC
ncbi:MAG: helix-turn-helix domain-containing protein [Firmicutes bacterium]|nr:helix-turn-helix domain-containing protein [Bacillota bacterium]